MRRSARSPVTRRLEYAGIVVDLDHRMTWVKGRTLQLTRTEFDLLAALISRPMHIQSRKVLADAIGLRTANASVAPHLSRLRRKIIAAGGPRIGVPVHGVGVRLAGGTAPSATAGAGDLDISRSQH